MSIINNEKVSQKSQQPSARNGDGQPNRVSTNEGSRLGSPKKAGSTSTKIPQVGT